MVGLRRGKRPNGAGGAGLLVAPPIGLFSDCDELFDEAESGDGDDGAGGVGVVVVTVGTRGATGTGDLPP